jgi:AcrR family transcriptional regulator
MTTISNQDPRAIRSREAILQAVIELLSEEGPAGITHMKVAERSGVGRATVYRHWPQPVDLFKDVFGRVDFPWLEQPGGTLRDRLGRDLRRLRDDLNVPVLVTMIASIMEGARHDSFMRTQRDRLVAQVSSATRSAIDEALVRGELRAAPEAADLVTQLIGPLFFRSLLEGRSATDNFLDQLIDNALASWTA